MFFVGCTLHSSADDSFAYTAGLPAGQAQILVARVVAGRVEPRERDASIKKPSDGYDSILGSVCDAPATMAYMVHDHRKSYPAYVVTYQRA
jgi:hypothetical protein